MSRAWEAWVLLRPVLEHLIGHMIHVRPPLRLSLGRYPYRGHLKRIFMDTYFMVPQKTLREVLEDSEKFGDFCFYDEAPQPHRWIRRETE